MKGIAKDGEMAEEDKTWQTRWERNNKDGEWMVTCDTHEQCTMKKICFVRKLKMFARFQSSTLLVRFKIFSSSGTRNSIYFPIGKEGGEGRGKVLE